MRILYLLVENIFLSRNTWKPTTHGIYLVPSSCQRCSLHLDGLLQLLTNRELQELNDNLVTKKKSKWELQSHVLTSFIWLLWCRIISQRNIKLEESAVIWERYRSISVLNEISFDSIDYLKQEYMKSLVNRVFHMRKNSSVTACDFLEILLH